MRSKFSLVALLPLLLAGCAGREHLRPHFGDSVRNNVSVQMLEPAAADRARPAAVSDGQKMEQALKDYRKGKPEASREQLIITTGK